MPHRVLALAAAIVLGAAIPSIAQTTAPATKPVAQATAPATQPVHIAKKGKLSVEIAGDGTLQPAEPFEVRLKFKSYAGPLTVVSAAQHQSAVRKGDVLLACEKTQYTWAMEQATNELALARANQQKAVADADVAAKSEALTLRVAEDGLKNAETSLKWWKDTEGPQMLQLADLTVTQYRNSVEDQGDELDQLKKMYNKEDLTKATADIVIKRALRRFDISKIHLKMQEDHCRKTKDVDYGIANQRVLDSVEVARQQLTSTQIAQAQSTVARKSSLANARIAVEQAQRKFEELQSDAALLDITAPADGMVVYAQVGDWQAGAHGYKAGDKPTPGALVMRLFTPGRLVLEANVAENQVLWITPGMKATVTPASLPSASYEATCSAPLAGFRGQPPLFSLQVQMSLSMADGRLLPGMKGSYKIKAGSSEEAILIPLKAVTAGKVTVKKADGATEERAVAVGRSDGQSVEINKGLVEGEQVIVK